MTAPLAQIAREIAHEAKVAGDWHPNAAAIVQEAASLVLTRHWPAARGVVEVTGEDVSMVACYFDREVTGVLEDNHDIAVRFAALLNERLRWPERNDGKTDAERARAVSAPVVVRRPVRTVTGKLVVPEDGVYVTKQKNNILHSGPYTMSAGNAVPPHYDAIRRIDTDAPTTWITRTEVQEPAPWTAGDVPEGCLLAYRDGHPMAVLIAATHPKDDTAKELNRTNASHVVILPTMEAPDARP